MQGWLGLFCVTLSCTLLVEYGGLSLIVGLMGQPPLCSGLYLLFGVDCNIFVWDSSPFPVPGLELCCTVQRGHNNICLGCKKQLICIKAHKYQMGLTPSIRGP